MLSGLYHCCMSTWQVAMLLVSVCQNKITYFKLYNKINDNLDSLYNALFTA